MRVYNTNCSRSDVANCLEARVTEEDLKSGTWQENSEALASSFFAGQISFFTFFASRCVEGLTAVYTVYLTWNEFGMTEF